MPFMIAVAPGASVREPEPCRFSRNWRPSWLIIVVMVLFGTAKIQTLGELVSIMEMSEILTNVKEHIVGTVVSNFSLVSH